MDLLFENIQKNYPKNSKSNSVINTNKQNYNASRPITANTQNSRTINNSNNIISSDSGNITSVGESELIDIDNLPDHFSSTEEIAANTNRFLAEISPDADKNVLALYNYLGDLEDQPLGLNVTYEETIGVVQVNYEEDKEEDKEIKLESLSLNIHTVEENDLVESMTTFHELAHVMDYFVFGSLNQNADVNITSISNNRPTFTTSDNYSPLLNYFNSTAEESLDNFGNEDTAEFSNLFKNNGSVTINGNETNMEDEITAYLNKISSLDKEIRESNDYEERLKNASSEDLSALKYEITSKTIDEVAKLEEGRYVGYEYLVDIYDLLSLGTFNVNGQIPGNIGHGRVSPELRLKEVFADYMALSVTRPELVELLRADQPELVESLDATVSTMLNMLNENSEINNES